MNKILLLFGLLLMTLAAQGKHLVGGDISYTCLGKDPLGFNLYEITLSVYKDCQPTVDFPTNTPFDTEVLLYVYDAQNNDLIGNLIIALTDTLILPLTGSDTCVAPPTNLCYSVGTYTTVAQLPDNAFGYEMVWGRCCRNETILNILQPSEFGMAINASIPPTGLCNSSPQFRNLTPAYICRNDLFTFDHSATDADGDELTYEIVTPFTAGSQMDPVPVVPPPPYLPIAWLPGYGLNNIMDGSPGLQIDPQTGMLTVRPQNIGQYVFSVQVTERRNGQIISQIRRDVQVNVIDCPINFPPEIGIDDNVNIVNDTLLFERGADNCFTFTMTDENGPGVGRDSLEFTFTDPNIALPNPFDLLITSFIPSPDRIEVTMCWKPPCDNIGFSENFIVFRLEDQNECPGPNVIMDTIYFKTVPPDLVAPEIRCVNVIDATTLQVDWEELAVEDQNGFSHFVLSRDDGNGFLEIARITDPSISSYQDPTVPDAENENYCYQLAIARQCPNLEVGPPSLVVCSEATSGNGLCAVSADSLGMTLSWRASQSSSFEAYRIYRVINGVRQLAEEITNPALSFWVDPEATDPGISYCYEMGILSGCVNEVFTGQHCSVPLSAIQNDFEVELSWGSYSGWLDGVARYVIVRRTRDEEKIIGNLPPSADLRWIDREISNDQGGNYCYRIEALPVSSDLCQQRAWSQEVCVSYEPRIYVANAFTPNADGNNDLFEIQGSFYNRANLIIYNRWGRKVFQTDDLNQSWDGTAGGKPVGEGVYVYLLEFEDFDGKLIKQSGSITLIR